MTGTVIDTLATNQPPPLPAKWKYRTLREANSKLAEMGQEPSQTRLSACARLDQLESLDATTRSAMLACAQSIAAVTTPAPGDVSGTELVRNSKNLLSDFNRISNPGQKTEYYRTHQASLDNAHKVIIAFESKSPALSEPQDAILCEAEAIQDLRVRADFMRRHVKEIQEARRSRANVSYARTLMSSGTPWRKEYER